MPRAIKPRTGWRGAFQVKPVKLSRTQIDEVCRTAGVDPRLPRDKAKRLALLHAVTEAIGIHRHKAGDQRVAPRPVHQQKALQRVHDAVETLTTEIQDLDDASREQLTLPRRMPPSRFPGEPERLLPGGVRRGVKLPELLNALDYLRGNVELALSDLSERESRGRLLDTPRQMLLQLLSIAFLEAGGDPDRVDGAEFLQITCRVAGIKLSDTQAQAESTQRLR